MSRLIILRRGALLACSVLAACFLLELYARLANWVGYGSQVAVETKARDEEVVAALQAGRSPFPTDARPILVLGDSMAVSPGVRPGELWSTLLAERLRKQVDSRIVVVNAAIPGTNTYQQSLMAHALVPTLKPAVVLLMYNANDVYGSHTSDDRAGTPSDAGTSPAPSASADDPDKGLAMKSVSPVARMIHFLRKNSHALNVFLPRANLQLKAWGFLMPGSAYHHMATKAYRDEFRGWRQTRDELVELREFCIKNNTKLLIYVLPEFDGLKFDHSAMIRRVLTDYFRSVSIPAGFGYEHFQGRSAEELAISPFDAHPNPKANREIADLIAEWLEKIGAFSKEQHVATTGPRGN